jgi:hypothetical protein
VEGARVILTKDSKKVDEAVTDNFGDFKFDNLPEDSGKYDIEISCEGFDVKTLDIDLKTSINLGTILL